MLDGIIVVDFRLYFLKWRQEVSLELIESLSPYKSFIRLDFVLEFRNDGVGDPIIGVNFRGDWTTAF